jgi:hypothetical protein
LLLPCSCFRFFFVWFCCFRGMVVTSFVRDIDLARLAMRVPASAWRVAERIRDVNGSARTAFYKLPRA